MVFLNLVMQIKHAQVNHSQRMKLSLLLGARNGNTLFSKNGLFLNVGYGDTYTFTKVENAYFQDNVV